MMGSKQQFSEDVQKPPGIKKCIHQLAFQNKKESCLLDIFGQGVFSDSVDAADKETRSYCKEQQTPFGHCVDSRAI